MAYRNIFTTKEKQTIAFNRSLLEQMFSSNRPDILPSYIVDFPHDSEEDKDIRLYLDKQITFFKEALAKNIPCVPILRPFFYGLHGHSLFFSTEVISTETGFWTRPIPEDRLYRSGQIDIINHAFTHNLISQIQYLQERTNYEIPVATPIIMSPLVIFTNLVSSETSFPSMLLFPEKVKHFLFDITRTIIELENILASVVRTEKGINTRHILNWVPPNYCTLYGCTLKLISKETYETIFLPFDQMILDNYKGGGIHLCGNTVHLIDSFNKMPKLSFLQLNDEATDHFEVFYRTLNKDLIFFVWPTKNMPVELILRISGGISGGNRVVYGGIALDRMNESQ